eukprot:scaffold99098_cov55-Attheya_sp.AAC.2
MPQHLSCIRFLWVLSGSVCIYSTPVKMINAGNATRRPDLYLNSLIDAFVEYILMKANNKT